MSSITLLGALEIGLIFGLVALGVYLSFRVLQFPDLTVDGSFPLGAAVAATLIVHAVNPWLATLAAACAGALAGLLTAWLNLRLGILNLLTSILTMIALYSINLRIMGRPNVALLVTHSLRQALDIGDRTVMLHQGRVAFDIAGPERARMDVPDLLRLFEVSQGESVTDDKVLLG